MYKKLGILGLSLLAILIGSLGKAQARFGFSNPQATPYIIVQSAGGPATTTELFGSFLPQSSGQFDIGSSTMAWRNVYASGTAYLATLNVGSGGCTGCGGGGSFTGASAFDVFPTTNNTFQLGYATSSWKTLYASSSYIGGIQASGNFIPVLNASFNLGAATSSWGTLYASSSYIGGIQAGGNFVPTLNASYNLGAATSSWNNVYASGTVQANTLVIGPGGCTGCNTFSGGQVTSDVFPNANNTLNLGYATDSWRMVYASSSFLGGIQLSGFEIPITNNTFDLGASTSSWNNVYASGTAYIATLNVGAGGCTGCATTPNLEQVSAVGAVSTFGTNIYNTLNVGGAFTATSTANITGLTTTAGGFISQSSSTVVGNFTDSATSTLANLVLTGAYVLNYKQINSATYTIVPNTDYYLAVSSTSQAVTISLPSATSVSAGTEYVIKDRNGSSSGKTITINANGTNLIDATSTYFIAGDYNSVRLVNDGASRWEVQ